MVEPVKRSPPPHSSDDFVRESELGAPGTAFVSIRDLKGLVVSRFPENHPLRTALSFEHDLLTSQEFLAKLEVWFALLNWKA
ncbi:MAG: hypothetical protein WC985_00325 [Thermoplasmata archaeon]